MPLKNQEALQAPHRRKVLESSHLKQALEPSFSKEALKEPHLKISLLPGWEHAITIIMGYSLKSEIDENL